MWQTLIAINIVLNQFFFENAKKKFLHGSSKKNYGINIKIN